MRVLVCGGRDYDDFDMVEKTLRLILNYGDVVIHGAAPGADSLAGKFADQYGIQQEAYPAAWDVHGKAAGPIRNQQMLDTSPHLVVAFPGGRGTSDMMIRAGDAGVPVLMVRP